MTDIYTISIIAVVVVTILSLAAIMATFIAVWNGSIRRYRQQREEHFKQYYRIQAELNRVDNNDQRTRKQKF